MQSLVDGQLKKVMASLSLEMMPGLNTPTCWVWVFVDSVNLIPDIGIMWLIMRVCDSVVFWLRTYKRATVLYQPQKGHMCVGSAWGGVAQLEMTLSKVKTSSFFLRKCWARKYFQHFRFTLLSPATAGQDAVYCCIYFFKAWTATGSTGSFPI